MGEIKCHLLKVECRGILVRVRTGIRRSGQVDMLFSAEQELLLSSTEIGLVVRKKLDSLVVEESTVLLELEISVTSSCFLRSEVASL